MPYSSCPPTGNYSMQVGPAQPVVILNDSIQEGTLVYGANTDIDIASAPEDVIAAGGQYAGFAGTAETLDIVSTSIEDAIAQDGARSLIITGLSATGAFQTEEVNLLGTVTVTSALTYLRVLSVVVKDTGDTNTNEGVITVNHTTTTANVFADIPVGAGKWQNAVYTVPINRTAVVRSINVSVSAGVVQWELVAGVLGTQTVITGGFATPDKDGSLNFELPHRS